MAGLSLRAMPRLPSWARAVLILLLALLPLRGMSQVWMIGADGSGAGGRPDTAATRTPAMAMPPCHSAGAATADAHDADAPGLHGRDGSPAPDEAAPNEAAAHGEAVDHSRCMLCDLCHGLGLPAGMVPQEVLSASLPCPLAVEAGTVQRDPRTLDKPPRR